MPLESSHDIDDDASIPETPGMQQLDRPMMTPPRMLSQQDRRREDMGVTPGQNNDDDSNNQVGDGPFSIRSLDRPSSLLDFPVMRQNHSLQNTSSTFSVNSRPNLSVLLNRETVRSRGRRRASSLDDLMPIPRIALKPRFSALERPVNSCAGTQEPSSANMECTTADSVAMSNPGRMSVTNITIQERQIQVERLRPRRATHFRHHTYGGSDASSNIFAEAMDLERSDASIPSPELDSTIPIVHNSFELSQLHQNLPPAAQQFIAPREAVQGSCDVSRPIPRHRRKRPAGDMSNPCQTSTLPGRQQTNSNHSNLTPSLGTPTCTCTLSTSSVSAFDQTSPPQWQEQSPGNNSANFQGLKIGPKSPESQKRDQGQEKFKSNADDRGRKSSLPFDEVHLLIGQGGINNEDDPGEQP